MRYSWSFKCKKSFPGMLTAGMKYDVNYNDSISFNVKADNKQTIVMTRDDMIEYFRIIL